MLTTEEIERYLRDLIRSEQECEEPTNIDLLEKAAERLSDLRAQNASLAKELRDTGEALGDYTVNIIRSLPEAAAKLRAENETLRADKARLLAELKRSEDIELLALRNNEALRAERDNLLAAGKGLGLANQTLRARVAEAERLLSLVQNGACEAAHHPKEDRHRIGEPCPVDARIRAWLHPSAGGG